MAITTLAVNTRYFEQMTERVTYRTARPGDIPAMTDLFLVALGDLYARNNLSTPVPPREAVLAGYEHVRSTGIFHVAEMEGEIAAIAGAILRDHIWYLSAFWAHPERQRQGVGMPLLRQVWRAGQEAGASTFFTWSSIDPTAMAAYMKLGMLPGTQILFFEGTASRLPQPPAHYRAEALQPGRAMAVDTQILGTGRPADHHYWSEQALLAGRQVLHNRQVAGYYYLSRGIVGPAAWTAPEHAEPVLALALSEAVQNAPTVRLAIPGMNHAGLRYALGVGLRLTGFSHFLTTTPFGQLEQYLPSGPSLF